MGSAIMAKTLRSTIEIYKVLGGTKRVAEIAGTSYNCASNWKSYGQFPPRYFLVIRKALVRRGYDAPPKLWNML